jgi:hypothetical protein
MQNKEISRQLLSRHLIWAVHSYFQEVAAGTDDDKLSISSGGEKQQW